MVVLFRFQKSKCWFTHVRLPHFRCVLKAILLRSAVAKIIALSWRLFYLAFIARLHGVSSCQPDHKNLKQWLLYNSKQKSILKLDVN